MEIFLPFQERASFGALRRASCSIRVCAGVIRASLFRVSHGRWVSAVETWATPVSRPTLSRTDCIRCATRSRSGQRSQRDQVFDGIRPYGVVASEDAGGVSVTLAPNATITRDGRRMDRRWRGDRSRRIEVQPYMRSRAALATLLLVVGGSCRSTSPVEPAVRRDLHQARERRQALAPREYTFESRKIAFVDPATFTWTELHVRDDSIVGTRALEPLPVGLNAAPPGTWHTVPRLFSDIEAFASGSSTQEVVATFDSTFGYPLSIEMRCRPDVTDCGVTILSRNLKVIR
jgi:Family of unknown function (DUF6174)